MDYYILREIDGMPLIREVALKDCRDLHGQGRNILRGGNPEDFPIQIEVGMDDAVADANDLTPRHCGVTVSHFRRTLIDASPITVK